MSVNTKENFGKYDFVGNINLFGGLSILVFVISVIYLGIRGINYGIDFKGGTEIQVRFEKPVTIDQIRKTVEDLKLGEVGVQGIGEGSEYIIRFVGQKGKTDKETNENLNAAIAKVKESLTTQYADAGADIRRVDSVGPQVGAELKRSGLLAVFYCLLMILIYVSMRFDYNYSPGAIACLFHDAVVTLAIFVMVGKEVNVPILAAILSLIGFSLNDTIVVFDRIRETRDSYKDRGWPFIINKAINDMLGRTFITAGSLFVSALCLYIFAGGVVSDIAFVITVGLIFGVYSSIFIAAPLILFIEKLKSATRAA
ncbi:MAG: protein-export rane protein SecF [Pseudobdellovibrio sp.]|jgi:preprotein translocase subunit SecF|nr:protein-export rane protein SecF [Pseudobdellovibrio sp.]